MDNAEIQPRLTQIFRDTFDDDTIEIREAMTAAEIPQWDSLSHINLIMAVEKGFGIRLTTREVRSMKNVGDFLTLIGQKTS